MKLKTAEVTERIAAEVRALLADGSDAQTLMQALRRLAKWRAFLLEGQIEKRGPGRIPAGPFKGMAYPVRASEGARLPRMLGCYEASLAPVIEEIIARAYPLVCDIGAAEGYYAVGLARRMPGSRVMARDGDARAQRLCARLGAANDVADRIEIGPPMGHADLDTLPAGQTVLICDIEGAEVDLLDHDRAPGLRHVDILVEVHEAIHPGAVDLLTHRFADSHDIRRIDRKLDDSALTGWMEQLSDLDRLLLLWEWRATPTPWLWMTRRTAHPPQPFLPQEAP
ncbi:hypothetical protein [Gemmobacter serpentinus]|uniref:hypothetical protein n=1 Tax=Gemmobacter serpentinus TaxID=2652247 RepID=UPI00124C211D|nr:hypothetical protein [Gemmobacter serpentinus]